MRRTAPLFALVFLVVFAASTVLHAASATTNSATMSLAGGGAMGMAGCDGCDPAADGHGDHLACDAVCLGPLAATLGPDGVLPIDAGEPLMRYAIAGLVGRTGRPEPFPPRTLV